ncbi:hypothetical protein MAPG_07443 [Magnaporthiopsis poae ATCC 64411]|uniref:HAD superfamily hydrolase n=1 Tax=Magnaporthiopsis poae (strain ATCC 64411 / 73-15) TaxID=644358 RepID=A0A0C4E4P5_MAGP6|nr:hypothetical protein MAPG_07443 [Magnaporthiopsis poae ATCC 64411]
MLARLAPHRHAVLTPYMRRLLSAMAARKPRQFAPLRPGAPSEGSPALQGVIFDVDGTLCKPQNYMFAEMRAVLGIPKSVDILDHIYGLPTPEAREEAMESIRAIERTAMVNQVAQPGLVELMRYLDSRNLPKGICTRNFQQPVAHLLAKFLAGSRFEPVITREFRPPKPHPAGILHIAKSWGLVTAAAARQPAGAGGDDVDADVAADVTGLIMVGDSVDDMTAGRRAGAATVLLMNEANAHLAEHDDTDLVITRLDDLIGILEEGFKCRATAPAVAA